MTFQNRRPVKSAKDAVASLSHKRCAIRITNQIPTFKEVETRLMAAVSTCEYANSYRICPQQEIQNSVESIFRIARKSMGQILDWMKLYEDKFNPPTAETQRIVKFLVILSDMLHDYGFDIEADGSIREAMVLEKLRRTN